MHKFKRVLAATLAATAGSLIFAGTAFAGIIGSAGPEYPTSVAVGQTGIPLPLQHSKNKE